MPRTPAPTCPAVGLAVKPVGEPYSGNRDLRFDERGWETERWPLAKATAPILDSTKIAIVGAPQRLVVGLSFFHKFSADPLAKKFSAGLIQ